MLRKVTEEDYEEVVELANVAYRKVGAGASWNSEAGVIAGQRLSLEFLKQELAEKPKADLLIYRAQDGELLGTVWLEPKGDRIWYLGLLTVKPERQAAGLGRAILAAAERYARERGGRTMRMTVLWMRSTLVAWYERRGYAKTGERVPFPYGDERFGKPLRDDLYFVVMQKDLEQQNS